MAQGDWALQPGRGGLRVARAVSTAAPSGALAVVAHSVGGGCLTPVGAVVTAAVLTSATYPMVARQRSAAFFVGWTALGQLLGHGILNVFCHDEAGSSTGRGMLGAHVLAVVLVGLTLRFGEARVWAPAALARVLRQEVRRLAVAFRRLSEPHGALPIRVRPVAAPRPPLLRLARWVSRCRPHRGPPRVLLAR